MDPYNGHVFCLALESNIGTDRLEVYTLDGTARNALSRNSMRYLLTRKPEAKIEGTEGRPRQSLYSSTLLIDLKPYSRQFRTRLNHELEVGHRLHTRDVLTTTRSHAVEEYPGANSTGN